MSVNTSNLGGPYNGFSAKQTIGNFQSGEHSITRRILRDSWNTPYATGVVEGQKRAIGPFRAVNNLGDFLGRQNYSCGGPNQISSSKTGTTSTIGSIPQQCDTTGIPPASTNVKFVSDSSDYIKLMIPCQSQYVICLPRGLYCILLKDHYVLISSQSPKFEPGVSLSITGSIISAFLI